MNKCILVFSAIALAVLGNACASYGPSTIWGGYDDKEIEPGIWKVSASANAVSGGEPFTRATVVYRAAEIAEAHGFSYIRVLNGTSDDYGMVLVSQTATTMRASWTSGGGPGYSTLIFRGASGPDDTDGCRAKKADKCATLSVQAIKQTLAPRLGLKPPAS